MIIAIMKNCVCCSVSRSWILSLLSHHSKRIFQTYVWIPGSKEGNIFVVCIEELKETGGENNLNYNL